MKEFPKFPLPTAEIHVWVVYLSARCNFNCSYCIQKQIMSPDETRRPWARYQELSGKEWVAAFNGLSTRPEHSLILTGGEPSLHPDFYDICRDLEGYQLEMTSNLTFDVDRLIQTMQKAGKRFHSAFHTYHPKWMSPEDFLERAEKLRDSGIIDQPIFSMVDLDRFPHFRDKEWDEQQKRFFDLARKRDFATQRNEFRGHHMGSAFDRNAKKEIGCTSSWVNFAPNGDIFNCQYHLESGQHAFGNITAIEDCKPLPQMGEWFSCSDFGYCDPCHENSGHGAFRDADGRIFRRDSDDARVYLQWMKPESLRSVARRFEDQGDYDEAAAAWLAVIGKEKQEGGDASPESWADLGITLWEAGQKKKGLAAILHALELGHRGMDALVAAVQIGRETDLLDDIRDQLSSYMEREKIVEIEQAAMAAFV